MADFAPPPGPPPPKVPEGWKAIWNAQYNEWFYVNTYTKQSQWEKPSEPVYPPPFSGSAPPPATGPPAYDHSTGQNVGPEKGGHLGSNNPYNNGNPSLPGGGGGGGGATANMSEDERLARQLQEEENARSASGSGPNASRAGASDGYYQGAPQSQVGQPYGSPYGGASSSPVPDQDRGKKSGGLLGKITSKLSGGSKSHQQQPQYGSGYPQQGYGGGYPQQGYGGYPQQQQQYGGYPQQGYGGYPPQQQMMGGGGMYGPPPPRRGGGGMGMAGGAALGAGAGLLGGAMLMNSMDNHDEQDAYQDGFEDGADYGDDGGGGE
ncbi:hypothetical protein CERZMDRAFT_121038 [Cercospora zeae-maydis SCOH1-5]|uniref:WW domain-containing protein n=1 Tax=Cercospora zeae-maydis SCOH1-5 TaxID=717836 RepID=A0A6A6FIW1_9PEZI|nr:hypothetical protein CERZMDRAFT_121038 [Cercospora zeae-maydis SCOH1-5]